MKLFADFILYQLSTRGVCAVRRSPWFSV